MRQVFYKWIFFRLMGWRITGGFDASIKKSVIIIVPHTSWYDFFIGLFARGIIGLEMHWVGKKELFRFPLKYYFLWMGGEQLDRKGGLNTVDAIAKVFKRKDVFRLAIAPEGTRKKVTELKTGFYYIALKANVPIIPVAFDYAKKEVKIFELFYPTGNADKDIDLLQNHFAGIKGKFRENSFYNNINSGHKI